MSTIKEIALSILDYLQWGTELGDSKWAGVFPSPEKCRFVCQLDKAVETALNDERRQGNEAEAWKPVEEVLWEWRAAAQLFRDGGLAARLGFSPPQPALAASPTRRQQKQSSLSHVAN